MKTVFESLRQEDIEPAALPTSILHAFVRSQVLVPMQYCPLFGGHWLYLSHPTHTSERGKADS